MPVATLRTWRAEDGRTGTLLYMQCPGCDDHHGIEVSAGGWTWDGNLEAPTVSPSIKVEAVQWDPSFSFHRPNHHVAPGERTCCHSFVKQGQWQFLGDCTHVLAGQTVPLPPLPEWLIKEASGEEA